MSRISEGNPAFVNRQSADEYTHPAKRVIDDTLEIKMRASVEMDNLLRASTFVRHVEDDGRHERATGGWSTYRTLFSINGQMYEGDIQIMHTERGRLFYDMTQIKEANIRATAVLQEDASRAASTDASFNSIISGGGTEVKQENPARGAEEHISNGLEAGHRYSLADEGESTPGITLEDVNTLRNISRKSINAFTSEEIRATEAWARKFYRELGTKSPFFRAWFGDWRENDTTPVEIVTLNQEHITAQDVPRGEMHNADTGWQIRVNSNGIDETAAKTHKWSPAYRSLVNLREILKNAVLLDTVVVSEPSKRLGTGAAFMHHLYCPVRYGGDMGVAKLYIVEDINLRRHYLTKIEMASDDSTGRASNLPPTPQSSSDATDVSVAKIFDFGKRHSEDFEADSSNPVAFSPKAASEVVNEDGTPKVVYHGTGAEFWTFDRNMIGSTYGADEEGFFFTDNRDVADWAASDAANVTGGDERIVAAHLRIKNPYVLANKDPATYYDARKEGILQNARERGADGIIINGNVENGNLYVVFDPEQIKSVTDNVGIFDAGNPDIRYSLFDETADASQLLSENERLRRLHERFASKVGGVSRYKGESSREAAHISSGKPTAHGGCLALRLRNSSGEQPMMARKVLWKKVVSLYPTRSATSLMGMAVLASRRQLALMRTCLTNSEKVTPISCLKCLLR